MDDKTLARLQSEVDGLSKALEERDQFIRKLSNEIAELRDANLAAQQHLVEPKNAGADTGKTADSQATTQKAETKAVLFSESRQEIEQLQEALNSNLSASQINAPMAVPDRSICFPSTYSRFSSLKYRGRRTIRIAKA